MPSIVKCSDLHKFFCEKVQKIIKKFSFQVRADIELYLVDLLAEANSCMVATPERSLVDQWITVTEAKNSIDRLTFFVRLGDIALFTSGFFPDYLKKRGLTLEYFAFWGVSAYRHADSLCVGRFSTYRILAENFQKFVQLIFEVREDTVMRTPERYVKAL